MNSSNESPSQCLQDLLPDDVLNARFHNLHNSFITHGLFTFKPTAFELRRLQGGFLLIASTDRVYVEHHYSIDGRYRGTLTGDELTLAELSGREPVFDLSRKLDALSALMAVTMNRDSADKAAA